MSLQSALAADPPQTHSVTESWKAKLFGMRGFPAIPADMTEAKLFPMIDEFGQYRHVDWPGKMHSKSELLGQKAVEADDLAKNPGPAQWDTFGGWKPGPQLAATGRFRTEKHDGKWWLVDPEGRLFWSHGIDCVDTGWSTTPITDREQWFASLPAKDSPLGKFYGHGYWAPHNYYEGKSYETYNFTAANLQRKYGDDWERQVHDLLHRRLRSWGMNTIGNWSEASIYGMRKTPYVVTIHSGGRTLEGSQGYWGKFADVFDPGFAQSIRAGAARHRAASADDPWCLGYFVDNELSWGNELSLAEAALASPADQPAKRAFLADLRAKYGSIEPLNKVWGTHHASWGALQGNRTVPDAKKAHDDLAAFATKTAEQYFHTCRDEVKRSAPNVLYLGCRFAWVNDRALCAAGKFCDVVSFNRYQKSVADLRLPEGVDRPIMIGEFHFGALDRGMFHTGLVATASQKDRADAYRRYVRSAIRHPRIVGTHWFQFGDEAVTGRGDGENYQIGFVDVCDTPYAETIAASREIGGELYALRTRAAAEQRVEDRVNAIRSSKR
ncbi:MAG: beta-agarase [Thermoguttaceae bacterium]